ncbi:MAG: aspartate carbamoyltransferase [Candidatus Kerfeldbacteria bacterium CG08_land_8_20_14_0_20_40_16]|uniref:Aspartate carbamoyltransferase n=1 Tax=Candidatus Kerfeldbacteria bacterium CG08_land_8_20_14_0_20_40_16 TaxID=2014244 RepID=A0A2H0YWS6_9BACT|nr:MAG: aspartate carbamoyltransferase [Candidatus Kerfeldbacteria bacterium CG08_land_8_20_14_0_20_40_16]
MAKVNFKNRDIISIKDFSKEEILHVLNTAKRFKEKTHPNLLKGKILASLFFEPSTRTRFSFESAMERLGGSVITLAEAKVSSSAKGESLSDSIRIVEKYCDAIVMRHSLEGSARLAAEVSNNPVINGGDGANQHPTQTFLDLFSILETQKKLNCLNIALVGDLKYGRTVHSLAYALSLFGCRLYLVSPKSLCMPDYVLTELKANKTHYSEHLRPERIMNKIDVFYATRIQKERFADAIEYEKVKDVYIINKSLLVNVKKNFRILHPLPRVNEINYEVDETPYAYYFQQASNGLWVRQALLALVLGGKI